MFSFYRLRRIAVSCRNNADWNLQLTRNDSTVKNAKQLKAVEIVSWDWLEDSLMKRTRKSARQYRMHKIASAHRKRNRNAPGMYDFCGICLSTAHAHKRGSYLTEY